MRLLSKIFKGRDEIIKLKQYIMARKKEKESDSPSPSVRKSAKKKRDIITDKPDCLNEKEEAFCHFFLDCKGVASRAYRMAFDTSNWKDESVWTESSKLANSPKVSQRIDEIRAERRRQSEVSRKRAEEKLWNIVNASMPDFLIENPKTGKMRRRTPFQIKEEALDAVESMEIDRDGNFRYKLLNAIKALDTLGKWNGWDAPVMHEVSCSMFGGEISILPEGLDNVSDELGEYYDDNVN